MLELNICLPRIIRLSMIGSNDFIFQLKYDKLLTHTCHCINSALFLFNGINNTWFSPHDLTHRASQIITLRRWQPETPSLNFKFHSPYFNVISYPWFRLEIMTSYWLLSIILLFRNRKILIYRDLILIHYLIFLLPIVTNYSPDLQVDLLLSYHR